MSLKGELLGSFAGLRYCGSKHRFSFGLNDGLLLRNACSGIESCVESSNLGHSGCEITGIGNAVLLSFEDGLLLLFNNYLLLCRCSCSDQLSIEGVHFSLKCDLLCGFIYGSIGNSYGSEHCFLFGSNYCLLLFGCSCGSEGSVECGNLCSESGIARITAGNALLLCFNNNLFLLFNNSLLLLGRFCRNVSSIELVHFCLKLGLLCSLCGANCCGLCHCFLLGKNNSLLLLGRSCSNESSIECGNFGGNLVEIAIFLSLDNGPLFSLKDSVLFFLGLCRLQGSIEGIHFFLELDLFLRQAGSLLFILKHRLLFSLNDSMLFSGSLCSSESGIECKDLCLDFLGGRALCYALLLCLYNGLLLNLEDGLLLVLGLSSLQSSVERVHISLELHLILGLNSGLSGLEHCALFSLDNSLLFMGRSCSLHCLVEFDDLCINRGGSSRVRSKDLLFGLDNSLLFLGSACGSESGIECHDLCLDLRFLFLGSESCASLAANNNVGRLIYGSRCLKSLLLGNDLCVLFTLDLSINLSLGKSGMQIFSLLGSLSSLHSKLQCQNIGLNSCQLCRALVCLLLQLCSFLLSLLLFLDLKLHLLATVFGAGIAFTLVREQDLLGSHSCIVCNDGCNNGCVGVND